MKIIAVTQARYGSTRLPAKVLKTIGNQTLLDIHLTRIIQAKLIDKLMLATTNEAGADKIINIANRHNIDAYKGSVNDVLERFYNCVKNYNPDYVVRLTSDCPLIDPEIIDEVISVCISSDYDYVSNTLIPTYPDGTDVEVFKFSALEKAFHEASLNSDREHVTPYIWRNSSIKGGKLFKSFNVINNIDYSNYRITIDTIEDFEVIKHLIDALGTNKRWYEYINYLNDNPEIRTLNSSHTRNEGYAKSLLND
jgi:spore coat polysaccharide biosynthesis protein SpsF (cytidylyltransferase family)